MSPDTFLKFSLGPFGVVMVKGHLRVNVFDHICFFLLWKDCSYISGASYKAYFVSVASNY